MALVFVDCLSFIYLALLPKEKKRKEKEFLQW
jgi:hypothetical protein